ncbi:Metallothionein-like protein 1 [Hibiscus syriacus]|uniref:Metallothionein-like protein n=1 Tax=Hibiscus syriacus TaxID=106335 RepID=A0A6A3CJU9_HIBSY|nr:metallothionein-like protein 1 isoform X2 [Hibiscus syriacus]KAE8727701.1 Metallothionein-like protein 1 [Hibiscus syriacus]
MSSGCNCGSSCSCGDNCSCSRNLNLGFSQKPISTETIISGVAPVKMTFDVSEMSTESGHGCKCGSNCTCDPCNC